MIVNEISLMIQNIKPKEDYKIIHWLGAVPIRKIIFIGKESDSSSTGKKNKQRE